MSFTLNKIFTTATAQGCVSPVREIAPCDALKPYIRCFWEIDDTPADMTRRVIPDCCADILIYSFDGSIHSDFCGVSNKSFIAHGSVKTFGIRFYAWSVCLFTSADANGTLNGYFPADALFRDLDAVAERINAAHSLHDRVEVAQRLLLETLRTDKENSDVMNGLHKIITTRANVSVAALSDHCALSKRALERKFRACTGLSPKEAIELIRYQLLWQQCLQPYLDVPDCVDKFGFYDEAHLYNDFKKYHGLPLPQAIKTL